MKKTIFAALIVLLALLAVTCELFEAAEPAQLTANEPGFVTLTIGTTGDRARALDSTQAQAVVEDSDGFFEVVFYKYDAANPITVRDSIDYAVWTGGGGTTWQVRVPIADYPKDISGSNSNVAVLFAGRKSDKTLLAIGLLTADANLTTTIPSELQFKLEPIASELSATPASSAFKITGTNYNAVTIAGSVDNDGGTNAVTNPLAFQIPYDKTGINASYTFDNMTTGPAVIVAAEGPQVNLEDVYEDPGASVELTATPTVTLSGNTAVVNFTFDTINSNFMKKKINIEVPVFAVNTIYSPLYGKQETVKWFIRGGLDNKKIDTGGAASAANTGGAILLDLVDPDYVTLPINSGTGL